MPLVRVFIRDEASLHVTRRHPWGTVSLWLPCTRLYTAISPFPPLPSVIVPSSEFRRARSIMRQTEESWQQHLSWNVMLQQLEGTHRVRISAVLLLTLTLTLTLTFDLSTPVGYPKVIPFIESEHFGVIRFLIMLRRLVWKCAYRLCDLDLWHINLKTISFLGYPKVIPCTKFEHFGIFRFWVMLQTNRQTDKHATRTFDPRQPTESTWVTRFNFRDTVGGAVRRKDGESIMLIHSR